MTSVCVPYHPVEWLLQYYVRAISDDWLHAETVLPLSFVGLILPERMPPHTGVWRVFDCLPA
jgi:hypothetical protein